MNTTDPALPNYVRPEVAAAAPDVALVNDLLAGTRRMWARAKEAKYLRQWKDESDDVYAIRRECETVFEGLARILSASVGMLFAKSPQLEWNGTEAVFAEDWENLDAMGTAGPVLAKRFADASIRDGLGLILVDHPSPPEGVVVTAANERDLNLRPVWALYQRAQVVSWRTATIRNRLTITQLVFEEQSHADDAGYGVAAVTRYRVLRLVPSPTGAPVATWTVWRGLEGGGERGGFVLESSGEFRNRLGETATALPIGIAYTGRTDAPLRASIPLLGVAWANLAHWRLSTALTFSREVASYAQGVVVGDLAQETYANGATRPGRLKMGPLSMIHLKGDGASFDWKAPPVEAFGPLERGIEEKLQQMGAMGAAFLVAQKRVAETAEAKRMDAAAENATLATAAQSIEDAWNAALEWDAWYRGIPVEDAAELTICKDFDQTALDAPTMAVYVDAVAKVGLPPRILLQAWQQGGRLPEDTDLDVLEAEMMAGAAAIDEAARLAAATASPTDHQSAA